MRAMGRHVTLAMIFLLSFSASASAATNVAVFNFQMTSDSPD